MSFNTCAEDFPHLNGVLRYSLLHHINDNLDGRAFQWWFIRKVTNKTKVYNMPKEEDMPIDIYYNKLLDWLIDRRHCNPKWQENASVIRENINTAIQDMPPNEEITNLLSGTYINYFHCKKIVELLNVCGEGSTNFFGQYSSKRMKDWQEIIQSYSNENTYLAESASMLMRNVNFEIPSLKRQIAKCQQVQRDCVRKCHDCNTNSSIHKEKYLKVCKQMGIKGDDVRKELVQLVEDLPAIFKQLAEKAKCLNEAVDFYRAFVKFVSQNDTIAVEDIMSMVDFVVANGNATVYQWKSGEVPSKIVEQIQTVDLQAMLELTANEDNNEDQTEIDWGDDGDIDWSAAGEVCPETVDICESIAAITVEGDGQENPEGGVASGVEALSVLEHTSTRNLFIDELLELQAFLEQRVIEMSSEVDMITVSQFQNAPEIIQLQTKENILDYLSRVSSVLTDVTSLKMQNLYLIQNSPRYVDRIANSLTQKLTISENLKNQVKKLDERAQNAMTCQLECEPKLKVLVKKTKELQGQMEREISSRYKERPVNIMGEINVI